MENSLVLSSKVQIVLQRDFSKISLVEPALWRKPLTAKGISRILYCGRSGGGGGGGLWTYVFKIDCI